MAVKIVKLIEGTILPNAAAAQYTSPAKVPTIIKKFTATNIDGGAGHTITIYICASGVAPSTANIVIDARTIGPLQTIDVTELINEIVDGGGTIQCFADDNTHVTIQASGVQIA